MEDNRLLESIAALIDRKIEPVLAAQEEMRRSQEEMRRSQEETNKRLTKLSLTVENEVQRDIRLLMEGQRMVSEKFEKLDRMEETLESVKSDVEVIKEVVTEHSTAIRGLKAVK